MLTAQTDTFGGGLLNELFGTIPAHLWLAAVFFGALGVILNIGMGVLFRDKTKNGREAFMAKTFWMENSDRMVWMIVVSTITFYIFIRFFNEFTGKAVESFWAFVTGFGFDFVINSFNKKRLDWISKIVKK